MSDYARFDVKVDMVLVGKPPLVQIVAALAVKGQIPPKSEGNSGVRDEGRGSASEL